MKLFKRIKLKPPERRQADTTSKNAEFSKLEPAIRGGGVFAVHKNRVSPAGIAEFGAASGIDQKKVVGKGRSVVDDSKVEVLLFEDGSWDFSTNWKRAWPSCGTCAIFDSGRAQRCGGRLVGDMPEFLVDARGSISRTAEQEETKRDRLYEPV